MCSKTKTKKAKKKKKLKELEEQAIKTRNTYRFWPGNRHGRCWPVRKILHLVQHGRCFYCLDEIGYEGENATIDHIIPKCRGGTREFQNVVLSCGACNVLKGDNEVHPDWVKERLKYFCGGAKGDPWPDLK